MILKQSHNSTFLPKFPLPFGKKIKGGFAIMAKSKIDTANMRSLIKHAHSSMNLLAVSGSNGIISPLKQEFEWDGSFVQKRFHSGRTDQQLGHNDLFNRSGIGNYHFHHAQPPHMPCCNNQQTSGMESLVDLLASYRGYLWTEERASSGRATRIFHALIWMSIQTFKPPNCRKRQY